MFVAPSRPSSAAHFSCAWPWRTAWVPHRSSSQCSIRRLAPLPRHPDSLILLQVALQHDSPALCLSSGGFRLDTDWALGPRVLDWYIGCVLTQLRFCRGCRFRCSPAKWFNTDLHKLDRPRSCCYFLHFASTRSSSRLKTARPDAHWNRVGIPTCSMSSASILEPGSDACHPFGFHV